MAAIGLRAAAWYLPPDPVAVADLPELPTLPQAHRQTCLALGIDRVPSAPDLDAVELAARAAQQALAQAGLSATELDVLITVEARAPRAFVASEATRLQAMLGADRALALSVGGLGCTSISPALLTARGLLGADPSLSNILVAHGSKPATPHRYRHPVTVNGDSGQALVVCRDGPVRILDILTRTSGTYWDLFRVDYRDRPTAQWREECTDLPKYSFQLAIETRERLKALYREILHRNALRPEEITAHLSQNLSVGALRFYEEALGVPIADACYQNLRRYGHLGPNDVLLNYYTAIGADPRSGTGRAIVFNVSPAASWSAMLLATGDRNGGHAVYL